MRNLSYPIMRNMFWSHADKKEEEEEKELNLIKCHKNNNKGEMKNEIYKKAIKNCKGKRK